MAKRLGDGMIKIADILSLEPMCEAPDVEGLTPEQISAVHMFKHEVLAACYRLYLSVPAEMVDPLLAKYLANLSKKCGPGGTVRRS